MVTFTVKTGGRPDGATLVGRLFKNEQTEQRYMTARHGRAVTWSAEIACAPTGRRVDVDTFNGVIRYEEYQTLTGERFWFGYGAGTSEHFDFGSFRLEMPKGAKNANR